MGMPASIQHRWTADEVRALPDVPGQRLEVVDGELLVSPSPIRRHQARLAVPLKPVDHLTRYFISTVVGRDDMTAPRDPSLDFLRAAEHGEVPLGVMHADPIVLA